MPRHHIPADALAAYAAGAATAGEDLFIATHLSFCPGCRTIVDRAEQLGESLLTNAPEASVPTDMLSQLLSRLDEPAPKPAPPPRCSVFPAPLARAIGPLEAVPWRTLGADLRGASVPLGETGQRVFLLDFPPRFRIPTHGHHGIERALVLRGGFTDERDSFERGDASWREDGGHKVTIDPEGRCTTLFVNDGAADFGPLTGVVDWWMSL